MTRILFSLIFFLASSSGYALCVKVEKANLRGGPGTKYKKSWEVYLYMPFQELKRKDKWIFVRDMDGDKHWVYAPLVTKNYQCAVVKVKKANLRNGPGTKYSRVPWGPADKYYAFKILKKQGDWYRVIDAANSIVWIHKNLVWVN